MQAGRAASPPAPCASGNACRAGEYRIGALWRRHPTVICGCCAWRLAGWRRSPGLTAITTPLDARIRQQRGDRVFESFVAIERYCFRHSVCLRRPKPAAGTGASGKVAAMLPIHGHGCRLFCCSTMPDCVGAHPVPDDEGSPGRVMLSSLRARSSIASCPPLRSSNFGKR